jgi:hypothetical protein
MRWSINILIYGSIKGRGRKKPLKRKREGVGGNRRFSQLKLILFYV